MRKLVNTNVNNVDGIRKEISIKFCGEGPRKSGDIQLPSSEEQYYENNTRREQELQHC